MPQYLGCLARRQPRKLLEYLDCDANVRVFDRPVVLASREQYRLKPKGHREKHGYQRFLYPDPKNDIAFDPLTNKFIKKPTTPKTVTIPPSAGMKRAQEFVYKSDTWRRGCAMGGPNRPPTEASAALDTRAERVAAILGHPPLGRADVGGASDGNFTAGIGVPTLDGLGAVGGGEHAENEHVVVAELPHRAALLAAPIEDLLEVRP